jgi:hypothetical protein
VDGSPPHKAVRYIFSSRCLPYFFDCEYLEVE